MEFKSFQPRQAVHRRGMAGYVLKRVTLNQTEVLQAQARADDTLYRRQLVVFKVERS